MDKTYTEFVVEFFDSWNRPKEERFNSYNEARIYIETHFQNKKNEYKFYQVKHTITLFNNYNFILGG